MVIFPARPDTCVSSSVYTNWGTWITFGTILMRAGLFRTVLTGVSGAAAGRTTGGSWASGGGITVVGESTIEGGGSVAYSGGSSSNSVSWPELSPLFTG